MNGVINAAVQIPPKIETSGVLNKNTGFPEPLSPYSNTTLPHPSADTSPNACIESADVPISRTHARHSSFQLRRPKPNASLTSGLISPTNGLPDGSPWADGSAERKSAEEMTRRNTATTTDQPDSGAGEDVNESEAQRAERERDAQGYREGERKKGLLRKLQLHKV